MLKNHVFNFLKIIYWQQNSSRKCFHLLKECIVFLFIKGLHLFGTFLGNIIYHISGLILSFSAKYQLYEYDLVLTAVNSGCIFTLLISLFLSPLLTPVPCHHATTDTRFCFLFMEVHANPHTYQLRVSAIKTYETLEGKTELNFMIK